ncbi:hypothetical protein [Georgenia thermotolerans]|uniref:hypothetical protein n=1 Tax=Georgenia thermotolerans TaxID=527326 RepID=UPI001265485F|nr:hypothetical protein [Georgenia thermotolerans]
MTDLAERIAAEHAFIWEELNRGNMMIPRCTCGAYPGANEGHAKHVAEVTEKAVREQIAESIKSYMDSRASDPYFPVIPYARMAKIARGEAA